VRGRNAHARRRWRYSVCCVKENSRFVTGPDETDREDAPAALPLANPGNPVNRGRDDHHRFDSIPPFPARR